jgi:GNAT superfamily N-acetyltransferase
MVIRVLTPGDHAAVIAVAESLPEWFDEDARHRAIPIDICHQQGFVAAEGDSIIGFITLYVFEGRLNIGWLGVRRDAQRKGAGKALLGQAEDLARALCIAELATFTLGDSVDYAPYEGTRQFYFRNGFEVYRRSQTDNPGCPEEMHIRKQVP